MAASVVNPSLDNLHEEPPFRGALDTLRSHAILGWVLGVEAPSDPVSVELRMGGQVVALATTGHRRMDLDRFVAGPCYAGFSIGAADVASDRLELALSVLDRAAGDPDAFIDGLEVRVAGAPYALFKATTFTADEAALRSFRDRLAARLVEVTANQKVRQREALLRSSPLQPPDAPDVRLVAFYLPQFHPTVENDQWWGRGFTEWSGVVAAKPNFDGHAQPRLPADLGFYDLRLDDVHRRQVELARSYGITAFCYHHYWFSGTSLLTLPAERHLREGLDLDFCLCWANENWSRRWDGSEHDVLMGQQHSEADDAAFIESALPFFHSPRYLKVDGAPLLIVYRLSLLANAPATILRWKAAARAAGFPDLHVCMAETFGQRAPDLQGADSAVEFPPHGVNAREITQDLPGLRPDFTGRVYDYADMVAGQLARPDPGCLLFRTASPAWDNTARKGAGGHTFHGASPTLFEVWLDALCTQARGRNRAEARLVFVNAWNEWAEGAVLEPERELGHANLRAVRHALFPAEQAELEGYARANAELRRMLRAAGDADGQRCAFLPEAPLGFTVIRNAPHPARCTLDRLNGTSPPAASGATLFREQALSLAGWLVMEDLPTSPEIPLFVRLEPRDPGGEAYVAAIERRSLRPDVAQALQMADSGNCWFGFEVAASLLRVAPGAYAVSLLAGTRADPAVALRLPTKATVYVG
ncbi:glycoside hydrolase family 99-like domain-containing protein [Roseococcus sp. DSY-14]|uniref:glycosyltransferase WbsX family protein n=1 Tax=Roseococcus sp. DSY-14 TaxID=3369650 RepID=UPI00387B90C4